jgi:hypothetical protein
MFPYSPEVLAASFAAYNQAYWPLPAATLGLMVGVLALAAKPQVDGARMMGAAILAAWAWVGIAWHLDAFAQINFAAPLYGALFLIQAALIGWIMIGRGDVDFEAGIDGFRLIGAGVALYGLAGYPLLTILLGGETGAVRLAGMAPGPTVLVTLGLFLMAKGRVPITLVVIPVLWCAVAGATASLMLVPEDVPLAVLGAASAVLIALKNRRARQAPR